MKKLFFESKVDSAFEKVVLHIGKNLFKEITPAVLNFNIIKFDGISVGDDIKIQMNFGKEFIWHSKVVSSKKNEVELTFIDVGILMLPFMKSWHHEHQFKLVEDGKTIIRDFISFECEPKIFEFLYYGIFYTMFKIRSQTYNSFFIARN